MSDQRKKTARLQIDQNEQPGLPADNPMIASRQPEYHQKNRTDCTERLRAGPDYRSVL